MDGGCEIKKRVGEKVNDTGLSVCGKTSVGTSWGISSVMKKRSWTCLIDLQMDVLSRQLDRQGWN